MSMEEQGTKLGPPDPPAVTWEEIERRILAAQKEGEESVELVAWPAVLSPWSRDDISASLTAYDPMPRIGTIVNGTCGHVASFPGAILAISIACEGVVGGTDYAVQAYVKPVGGAATATGITKTLGAAESEGEYRGTPYPFSKGDVIYIYDKRTGALNAESVLAALTVRFAGLQTPLAASGGEII